MARLRPYALALLAVALTHSAAWSDTPRSSSIQEPEIIRSATASGNIVSRFYSLADLGDDPGFAKWVVQTLQSVVQPGTWGRDGCTFSYYAPKKILVVCHCPAAHDEVNKFLCDMRLSLASGKEKSTRNHAVSPAQYQEPGLVKTTDATPSNNLGYPVPAQVKQPKHLFHFIIRYEGEGIIDSNVADLFKQVYGAATKESQEKDEVLVPGTLLTPGGHTLKFSSSNEGPAGPRIVAPNLPSSKPANGSGNEELEELPPPRKADSDNKSLSDLPPLPLPERQSKSRLTTPPALPYAVPAPLSYPRTLRRS
jgi:hypothetical protein